MRRLIPLSALVVVLLTGCRAEISASIDVESTGAGTVAFEVGMDEELQGLVESQGGTIEDSIGELPEGATALEPRTEGDLTVYGFTRPFASPEEIEGLIAEGTEGFNAEATTFELAVVDGGATLDASLDVPDATESFGDLGDLGGVAGQISEFLTVSVRVHLPGTVVESNADRTLDDGSLVWDLPLQGGTVDIEARSEADSGFPLTPVLIGVGIAAIGGAALYLITRRRGDGADAIASTAEPPAPTSIFGDDTAPAPPAPPDQSPAEPGVPDPGPADPPVDPGTPDPAPSTPAAVDPETSGPAEAPTIDAPPADDQRPPEPGV